MRFARACAGLLVGSLLVALGTVPAHAQTLRRLDARGDGLQGRALDITHVVVANRPHHVVATISFVRLTHGDVAISFKRAGNGHLLGGVFSVHTRRYTTHALFSSPDGLRPCRHLVVRWEPRPDRVRIVIPSHCLGHGHFGSIKARVISQIGDDADYFPDPVGHYFGWSHRVARG